eukprot:m.26541 g.26541  ORF g.26541 m.26541 type:complete len:292 (+) comp8256_c1_seq1:207-1082(+)
MGFRRVLVDEATQATELSTLMAVTAHTEQMVLVGDPCQLPPTFLSSTSTSWDDAAADAVSSTGNNQDLPVGAAPLFQRLFQQGHNVHFLSTQYRMTEQLASFPNDEFYQGRLTTGREDQPSTKVAVAGFAWPSDKACVAFVPVPNGEEKAMGTSLCNHAEAAALCSVVADLIKAGTAPASIGIITPYTGQATMIGSRLRNVRVSGVTVSSVDGFQGQERDIVLVSLVRANGSGVIGFASDWRRANVALTRARNGLVVFGHEATFACAQPTPVWHRWMQWARHNRYVCEGGY